MFMDIWRLFLIIFAFLCFTAQMASLTAYAASFDCTKAKSLMEKTIFSNPELSKLDEDLAKIYSEVLTQLNDNQSKKQEMIQAQRKWLADLKPGTRKEKIWFKGIGATSKEAQMKARTESYIERYKDRVQILDYKLSLLKATPSMQEIVAKTFEKQLDFLKRITSSATKIAPYTGNSDICKQLNLWGNVSQLTLPKPEMFIATKEQKQAAYLKFKEKATRNYQAHLQSGKIKTESKRKDYTKKFENQWKNINICDFDNGGFKATACMLFNNSTQPFMATVVFDVEGSKGFSLGKFEFDSKGLIDYNNVVSYSAQYMDKNIEYKRLEDPDLSAPAYRKYGVAKVANQTLFWTLGFDPILKLKEEKGDLHFEHIVNPANGRVTDCGYEFYFKPAKWMKEVKNALAEKTQLY